MTSKHLCGSYLGIPGAQVKCTKKFRKIIKHHENENLLNIISTLYLHLFHYPWPRDENMFVNWVWAMAKSTAIFYLGHSDALSNNMLFDPFFNGTHSHIDGLVQDCSNSIATALELLQSCTQPLIYPCHSHWQWHSCDNLVFNYSLKSNINISNYFLEINLKIEISELVPRGTSHLPHCLLVID